MTNERNADTAKQMGSQSPKVLHHRVPLALDLIYELFRANRNKVLPAYLIGCFARAGSATYSYEVFDRTTFFTTCQPSSTISAWDLRGGQSFRLSLSSGIFTEGMNCWRSRSMLRPHFSRSQISDFRLEELHI